MPRRTTRPEQLADAALEVLGSSGSHGLTHRRVDAAAGVPAGTTSNYFGSRDAILRAAANRLLELQLADLNQTSDGGRPGSRDDLEKVIAALAVVAEGAGRARYLAREELALESSRRPELANLMRELRAVTVRQQTLLLRAAGLDVSEERVDWLGSLLTGVALDRLTLGVPGGDLTALIRIVCAALLTPGE